MTNDPVQIIYLNGPSSSGKTTLAKALQHSFETLFLLVGIDKIIGWMPEKVNDWTGGEAPLGYSWRKDKDAAGNLIHELQSGPYAKEIAKTFQEIVLLLAQKGHPIIIDDVSFGKQQIDEWKKLLKDFHVLWVGVNAPLDVLEKREKERGNRMIGSARAQFHKVHVDVTYDLEIDTRHASNAENVKKIQSLVKRPKNRDKRTLIRPLNKADISKIVTRYSFPWSTQEKTQLLWDSYYQEQHDGIRTVAVIEENHEILGYGSLLRKPESPFFAQKNIPEINAIWIDENHRKQGLGTALIKWLEKLASQESYQQIGIGVGLYKDYGPAQKLYFELGYSPEGNGITYKGESTIPGQSYPLDDDLILWLTKDLMPGKVHEESVQFHFNPVKPSQRALLHRWFEQPHIKEWMHGVGLQNTLNGLEKFFEGKSDTTYWVGYEKDTPFAFLITSPEGKDATTLDVFICDVNYLGKGLSVPMIRKFLIDHFSHVKKVLIDPEATNSRAIHVYKKVGFKIIGEFIASWHPVPHYQMELYIKNLLVV